jgi:hypothetical protein
MPWRCCPTASASTGAPAHLRPPAVSPAQGAEVRHRPADHSVGGGAAHGRQARGRHERVGYSPAVIRSYVGLGAKGARQTIAIVEPYDDPDITADAEQFSEQ